MKRNWVGMILIGFLVPGCSGRKASTGFGEIQNKVNTLIEKRIEWEPEASSKNASSPVDNLLQQKEIPLEAAVQIALLKNPTLQAIFEELGIAEADVREAGLMKNPVFFGEVRF